ncbi:hypothetical protein EMIHUDRAFT_243120 [Emiliania huxleyi CCMP1516]|uniref:C2H2-type domain-containing protein n=2 Tax=Emiliania huxleyi TaxID=2903 RepID=A0A0D3J6T9_EMIH1|nr:hypothetical protein EMIHUDRAFT_243120 [Emiliania huxleyi CCMP1516]EOD19224.1 hypothetical protein EMIHUDRAFT_243120 [Emiliania huxleyi CCMP1516]|eukprot:XP_005771653.1 hypothetical protein EMIHUDRAFT_243120 [Emiliania huxleyi CCMP1516]
MPRVCWGAELSGTRSRCAEADASTPHDASQMCSRCRVELAIPYDRVRTLDKDTANKLRMTKTSGAPRYVSRFVCRYNGCGKDYVSMDGVRAHCRKDHPAWLNSLPARKPSLFCEQKQVEIEIATSTAADSMAPVPDEYLHEGEGGALFVKFKQTPTGMQAVAGGIAQQPPEQPPQPYTGASYIGMLHEAQETWTGITGLLRLRDTTSDGRTVTVLLKYFGRDYMALFSIS